MGFSRLLQGFNHQRCTEPWPGAEYGEMFRKTGGSSLPGPLWRCASFICFNQAGTGKTGDQASWAGSAGHDDRKVPRVPAAAVAPTGPRSQPLSGFSWAGGLPQAHLGGSPCPLAAQGQTEPGPAVSQQLGPPSQRHEAGATDPGPHGSQAAPESGVPLSVWSRAPGPGLLQGRGLSRFWGVRMRWPGSGRTTLRLPPPARMEHPLHSGSESVGGAR